MDLKLRTKEECKFDAVSLGEIMLRLDPGEGRIRTARSFRAWEGGGEYNVVRGLHKCFGMNTGVITAFADNEVGKLMKDFIEQGGVSTELLYWKKTDKIYKGCIFGIFLTVLFGMRFLIEFIKNDQVDFEAGMQFNMGQLLSIPFIIAGIIILMLSLRNKQPLLRIGYDEEPKAPKENDHRSNLSKEQRMSAAKRKAMGIQ